MNIHVFRHLIDRWAPLVEADLSYRHCALWSRKSDPIWCCGGSWGKERDQLWLRLNRCGFQLPHKSIESVPEPIEFCPIHLQVSTRVCPSFFSDVDYSPPFLWRNALGTSAVPQVPSSNPPRLGEIHSSVWATLKNSTLEFRQKRCTKKIRGEHRIHLIMY